MNVLICSCDDSAVSVPYYRCNRYSPESNSIGKLKIYAKFFGVYIGLSYLCSIND